MRLFADTNIIVDFLSQRRVSEQPARLLFALCALGEIELWVSSSQITDVYYIVRRSYGVADAVARAKMIQLRKHLRIHALSGYEVDSALRSDWADFEDACVYYAAVAEKVDAIITGNQRDFSKSSLRVVDYDGLFDYLENELGLVYDEIPF